MVEMERHHSCGGHVPEESDGSGICDTVAGLVEVPCVKRNVVGAVNAIASADMALAGIRSQIPPDEVVDAMREVGESLPRTLRETGEGALLLRLQVRN